MTEELSDFPQAFHARDEMPWERSADGIRWRWGADKGKLLTDISSRELIRKRNWLERDRVAFASLLAAIEKVLKDRNGL